MKVALIINVIATTLNWAAGVANNSIANIIIGAINFACVIILLRRIKLEKSN